MFKRSEFPLWYGVVFGVSSILCGLVSVLSLGYLSLAVFTPLQVTAWYAKRRIEYLRAPNPMI